jgi:hypothetical protein
MTSTCTSKLDEIRTILDGGNCTGNLPKNITKVLTTHIYYHGTHHPNRILCSY